MPIEIPLLKVESEFISQQISGITTITFFKGDLEDVIFKVKKRFKEILTVNPWLTGKLVQTKGQKRLQLTYASQQIDNDHLDTLVQVNPKNLSIHANMKYMELAKALKPAIVQKPKDIINQDFFVTKLTLCNDLLDKTAGFSLIFSLSHSVADGHTYYKVLNMLCAGSKVYPLNVKRKEEEISKIINALGKREYTYINSFSHVVNVFKGLLLRKNTKVYAFYIDQEKIEGIKAQEKQEDAHNYVSSNDILTSTYSNFLNTRLTLMAINFRNRITGLNEYDAGNYEGAILYDTNTYSTPSHVRKSLQTGSKFKGLSKPLPGLVEGMVCKMGLITNWASFSKELHIEGCEELLHLPIANAAGRIPYEMAVIFRARKEKTGIIYFTQKFEREQFTSSILPVKISISKRIF